MHHGAHSEIFGDFLELVDRAALLAPQPADGVFKAMIEMIRNQGLLGLADGLFDRMQLLGYFKAGPAGLDHFDDGAQMPIGPLQALDDFRVAFMEMEMFNHLANTI